MRSMYRIRRLRCWIQLCRVSVLEDAIEATPRAGPTPLCTEDRSCRACRPDDCFDEALSEVCLTSVACQQCVDIGVETPQGDSEGSALNMNPQANVYGCSEYSETPICDLGTCRGCANDDECETRPGSAISVHSMPVISRTKGERGHCMRTRTHQM